MLDQLVILAESGSHASEGISPFLVGGGFFVILMSLLGITYLFGGLHQHGKDERKPSQRDDH